jgi:eukaryotic-like serine/threonine-protein kinase
MTKASVKDPLVGTIIDGKYRVDKLLDQGGMGRVYRVTHLQLDKIFALKLMKSGIAEQEELLARFRREAEALAKIQHPNVVMVTDYGLMPDKAPFIVMEFIEGITLRQLLKTPGQFTEQQVIRIGKHICAGLHEAHSRNIIHRDLKPENIMVQQFADGELMARVLDFGIAKMLKTDELKNIKVSDDTTGRSIPGTLKYLSPEQMLGESIDARADVFGICMILYEILTGVVPAVMVTKVKSVNVLRPDVSTAMNEILMRGLAREPSERQQTALELKKELETIEQSDKHYTGDNLKNIEMAGIPSDASSLTALTLAGATQTNVPQRTTQVWLWAVLLLVLIGGGVGAWQYSLRPDQTTNQVKLDPALIPQLVPISGGDITIGNNKGKDTFAKPEFDRMVTPFQVSRFLVTNRQYGEFVKSTNHAPPNHWGGNVPPAQIIQKPVTNITWYDAVAYCNWLTQTTKRSYRLIKEEEWEYLARNHAKFGVEEILTGFQLEWTGTEFALYPGSTAKHPSPQAKLYCYRGREDNEYSADSPITYRGFQEDKYQHKDLSFRVASDERPAENP